MTTTARPNVTYPRYYVQLCTRDGEPELVTRTIARFGIFAEAVELASELNADDPDAYAVIYDRDTEDYV